VTKARQISTVSHNLQSPHWLDFYGGIAIVASLTLNTGTLQPLGDRLLVKVATKEEKTVGGIFLPDTAQEKPQIGEVTAVGPGVRNDKGTRVALEVKAGDKVLYSKYAGTEVKIDSVDYLLLAERDILAIVE